MQLSPPAVAVLGLLVEQPMHPYQMLRTLIARHQDTRLAVRPGSLYRAVDRLVADGFAVEVGTDRAGNRPERTTFAITDEGRDALENWLRFALRAPSDEYSQFVHAIEEAHNLPADEVADLLGGRIALLEGERHSRRTALAQGAAVGKEERWLIELDYRAALLTAEIEWLNTLVGRIRSGALAWRPETEQTEQTEQ